MIRKTIFRSLVVLVSLALTLVVLEVSLARFVDVTGYLEYEELAGVGLRLKPGQEGYYIAAPLAGGPRVRGHFHVNNVGFNSLRDYRHERTPGVHRIAVVGDSFVEALQIDTEVSLQKVIEDQLKSGGVESEVYSFGISGYGTAQIYNLLKKYVLEYHPDVVIYIFAPNDVEDSSPWLGRNPWTQQYDLDQNRELAALPMTPYRLPFHRELLKRSKLFRLLYYQGHWGARLADRHASRRSAGQQNGAAAEAERKAWEVVELLLVKMDRLLTDAGIPWTVVWQADADPSYRLDRRIPLEEIVARRGIPYLDPTPAFEADFAVHHSALCIRGDGHWSADGHRVVGHLLAQWTLDHLR